MPKTTRCHFAANHLDIPRCSWGGMSAPKGAQRVYASHARCRRHRAVLPVWTWRCCCGRCDGRCGAVFLSSRGRRCRSGKRHPISGSLLMFLLESGLRCLFVVLLQFISSSSGAAWRHVWVIWVSCSHSSGSLWSSPSSLGLQGILEWWWCGIKHWEGQMAEKKGRESFVLIKIHANCKLKMHPNLHSQVGTCDALISSRKWASSECKLNGAKTRNSLNLSETYEEAKELHFSSTGYFASF